MMHAVVLNITEQLKEKVTNIEKVFINGNKDVISMFEEGYFTIIQEQRDIMKNLRALQPPERECKAAGLWDEREKLLAG
jgi:calcineurin-like phosphoesterase family protein